MIKKIEVGFENGYITSLESDTLMGYVFAHFFDDLKDIFQKFLISQPPFVFSNGFESGFFPKPIIKNFNQEEKTLLQSMKDEKLKKQTKNISMISIKNVDLFLKLFDNSLNEDEKKEIFQTQNLTQLSYSMRASVPRFDAGDSNPFGMETKFFENVYTIYVKIFDQVDFDRFFGKMKILFQTIGRGKQKSIGQGHIKYFELKNLSENETRIFEFLANKEKNGYYYILNNFKPSKADIENLDLEQSYYLLNSKNSTSSSGQNPFKGMHIFFKPGSVLRFSQKPTGDYYKTSQSKDYNFGFIF